MLEHESVEKKEEQDIAAASLCARLAGILALRSRPG
jgi:hypothetical protein